MANDVQRLQDKSAFVDYFFLFEKLNPLVYLVQPNFFERTRLTSRLSLANEVFADLDPANESQADGLRSAAIQLEKFAGEADGTAAFYSWIEAAALWTKAGEMDRRLTALESAAGFTEDPFLSWVVVNSQAMAYVEQWNSCLAAKEDHCEQHIDAAIGYYADFDVGESEFLTGNALYNQALLLEEAGRKEDAIAVLNKVQPESSVYDLPGYRGLLKRLKD
jgi:tetratricopeptide (TPR) repeat protein